MNGFHFLFFNDKTCIKHERCLVLMEKKSDISVILYFGLLIELVAFYPLLLLLWVGEEESWSKYMLSIFFEKPGVVCPSHSILHCNVFQVGDHPFY